MKGSWVKDQMTNYCHEQNRLDLGTLIEFIDYQIQSGVVRNEIKS